MCFSFYAAFFPYVITSSPVVSETANNLTVPKSSVYILNPDSYPKVQSHFCTCILNTSRATYKPLLSLVFSVYNGSSGLPVAQTRDRGGGGGICGSSFSFSSLPPSSSSVSPKPVLSYSHPGSIYLDLSSNDPLKDLFANSFVSPNPFFSRYLPIGIETHIFF